MIFSLIINCWSPKKYLCHFYFESFAAGALKHAQKDLAHKNLARFKTCQIFMCQIFFNCWLLVPASIYKYGLGNLSIVLLPVFGSRQFQTCTLIPKPFSKLATLLYALLLK